MLLEPVAKRNCGGEEWASHYYNYSCYTPVRTSLSQHSGNYPAVQPLIDGVTDSPAGLELQENPSTASAGGAGAAATLLWSPGPAEGMCRALGVYCTRINIPAPLIAGNSGPAQNLCLSVCCAGASQPDLSAQS